MSACSQNREKREIIKFHRRSRLVDFVEFRNLIVAELGSVTCYDNLANSFQNKQQCRESRAILACDNRFL